MGDPYPEEEARELLRQLVGTAEVERADILRAKDGWWQAAQELREIAEQLNGNSVPSNNRQAAWIGSASESATAAFDALANQFLLHAGGMEAISKSIEFSEQAVTFVADQISGAIGTELKPKPKKGLFGSGIGPSVGPDLGGVVDAVTVNPGEVLDGMKAVAANPTALLNKDLLLSGVNPLAAVEQAGEQAHGAEDLSREEQFQRIKEVHGAFSEQMCGQSEGVVQVCSDVGHGTTQPFSQDSSAARFGTASIAAGGAGAVGSAYAGSSAGRSGAGALAGSGSVAYRADSIPDYGRDPITGAPLPSTWADGGVTGSTGLPLGEYESTTTAFDPTGGGGSSPGAGIIGGSVAATAGIGGAIGAALGLSRAGAAGAAGAGSAGGVIGGSAGAVAPGVLGGGGPNNAAGAGARGAGGGAGMVGGMGGAGGGTGGSSSGGPGTRYGDAPQLSERGRRRRHGPRHAALGAGRRGGGEEPDEDDAGSNRGGDE